MNCFELATTLVSKFDCHVVIYFGRVGLYFCICDQNVSENKLYLFLFCLGALKK